MLRRWIIMLTVAALMLSGGCAAPPTSRFHRTSLLFDAQPAALPADQYATRTNWPVAGSFTEEGESIQYREYFYDRQGDGFHHGDHFTRRFTAIRKGRGHR